jgi:hypothetical protein
MATSCRAVEPEEFYTPMKVRPRPIMNQKEMPKQARNDVNQVRVKRWTPSGARPTKAIVSTSPTAGIGGSKNAKGPLRMESHAIGACQGFKSLIDRKANRVLKKIQKLKVKRTA